MSVLDVVSHAARVRRTAQSDQIFRGLKLALGAMTVLQEAGCTVHSFELRGALPVLKIDPPGDALDGSILMSHPIGRGMWTTRFTTICDCRVQWIQVEPEVSTCRLAHT